MISNTCVSAPPERGCRGSRSFSSRMRLAAGVLAGAPPGSRTDDIDDRGGGYSRPNRSASRNHQAIHSASRPIRKVSFEVPRVRSRKKKGTSLMRAPCFWKR